MSHLTSVWIFQYSETSRCL